MTSLEQIINNPRRRKRMKINIHTVLLCCILITSAYLSVSSYNKLERAEDLADSVVNLKAEVNSLSEAIDSYEKPKPLDYDALIKAVVNDIGLDRDWVLLQIGQYHKIPASNKFRRNVKIPLVDQTKNPGGLNIGVYARRYGCTGMYQYKSNITAVCPTISRGIAALVNMILARRGLTVLEYLIGGPNLPAYKSYSGGADYTKYIKALEQRGIDMQVTIHDGHDFLEQLVLAHQFAEGGNAPLEKIDFLEAYILVRMHAPQIAGHL